MSEPPDPGSSPDRPVFLLDQNVQHAVQRFLEGLGFEVRTVRDASGPDTPDEAIAFMICELGWILVTHDKDFKKLDRFFPEGEKAKYRRGTGILLLQVDPIDSVAKLEEEWPSIEFHYRECIRRSIRFQVKLLHTGVSLTTNAPGVSH